MPDAGTKHVQRCLQLRWRRTCALVCLAGLSFSAVAVSGAPGPDETGPASHRTPSGPYVILTHLAVTDAYFAAAQRLRKRHGGRTVRFETGRIAEALSQLRAIGPTFVAVVLRPETLDVNVAYDMLELSCRIDDDPFPDFVYGFITAANANEAVALVDSAVRAAKKRGGATRRLLLFGPSDVSQPDDKTGLDWLPGWEGIRLAHKPGTFPAEHLGHLCGRDIIRFWGHGAPDSVDGSLASAQLEGLDIGPAVVFAGPCFSAVTHRSFHWECCEKAPIKAESLSPSKSLALSFVAAGASACLGALHEDRCTSAAREMEYLLGTGEPVGFAVRHTYDTVVMAGEGEALQFPRLRAGAPPPEETPVGFQMNRAASRILIGDPALRPFPSAASEPVKTTTERTPTGLIVEATVVEPRMRSMFTDVFHADLCTCDTSDDVLYFRVELPAEWEKTNSVSHSEDSCPLNEVKHSAVRWAEELWLDRRILHIQLRFAHCSLKEAGLTFRFDVTTDAQAAAP